MLKIITHRKEISNAQAQFEKAIIQILSKEVKGRIGHKGENWHVKFNWSGKMELWAVFGGEVKSRYWNAFGLNEPESNISNSITAEINFPLEGIDRKVAGVLVKDEKGNIFVCHRGRIGGGAPGIGKGLFNDNYRGEWAFRTGPRGCNTSKGHPVSCPNQSKRQPAGAHGPDSIDLQIAAQTWAVAFPWIEVTCKCF